MNNEHHDHDHSHDHGHHHDHDHAHAHGHHHDHDDPLHPNLEAELNVEELDPAGKSLADALRVSFAVLKFVMIALIVAYLFSGMTNVKEGTVAVRTIFGSVQGDPSRQVLQPGGPYLWWPEPIGQFVTVPTSVQKVSLNDSFWFAVRPGLEAQTLDEMEAGELMPGRDGSLITADRNIVHAKWQVNFQIVDPVKFIRNVGFTPTPRDLEDMPRSYRQLPPAERPLYSARQMVRFAVERAIVRVTAQTPADEFVRSNINRDRILSLSQSELDELGSGLRVTQVLLEQPTPPIAVRPAFQAVSQAESERTQRMDTARQEAAKILNEAAGGAYRALDLAIDYYEAARRANDQAAIEQGEKIINALLERVPPAEALRPLLDNANVDQAALKQAMSGGDLGGRVAQTIADARTYYTETVAQVRRFAETFQQLLPQYQQNPRIFAERRWQDVRREILSGDVETIYYPSDPTKTMEIEINRDPRIQKERERRQYQAEITGAAAAPAQ